MAEVYDHLGPLVDRLGSVAGDFAEFGAYKGRTLVPLARAALDQGRLCHGIDSFCGMREPTDRDRLPDGSSPYERGDLDPGGTVALEAALLAEFGCIPAHVKIWQGFIPEILESIDIPGGLALAHVDLDQYAPTLAAMRWAWDRMRPGGILACHDYLPQENAGHLTTGAIGDWMTETGQGPEGHKPDDLDGSGAHIWFTKATVGSALEVA